MSSIRNKRLFKELKEIRADTGPVGINLVTTGEPEGFDEWLFTIEVMGESVYPGEVFTLKFKFDASYPISAPAVTFLADATHTPPVHPHVYSNGHICASILGQEWSPVLSVVSVCITLQSMLASCKKKERPPDNDKYVKRAPSDPKKTRFEYHDDDV